MLCELQIQRKGVRFMKKTMALILVLMFALGCLSSCENTPNEVSQKVLEESAASDFESSVVDDERPNDNLMPTESYNDRTDSLEKVFCTATLEDEFRDNQIVIVVFPETFIQELLLVAPHVSLVQAYNFKLSPEPSQFFNDVSAS